MDKWDAIVVGAGFSGLAVGALMSNAGKRVLILEKDGHIGGRAYSTDYQGQVVENGIHGVALTGQVEEVFSRLGKPLPDFTHYPVSEVLHEGKWQDMGDLYDRKALGRIVREEILAKSYAEIENQDNISIKEWVSRLTDDPGIHFEFFYMAWNLLGGNRYEDVAASTLLLYIKSRLEVAGSMRGGMANPTPGIRGFTQPLAEIVLQKGSEIRVNAPVESIVIEDGRAVGVLVETGDRLFRSQLPDVDFIEAPVVVNTLPVWDLFDVVSQDVFPRWYVEWIEGMKQRVAPVFTLICGMDARLWDDRGISKWVPNLPRVGLGGLYLQVPYGDQVGQEQLVAVLQSHWTDVPSLFRLKEAETRLGFRRIWDLFEADTRELFPEFEKHCLWRVRHLAAWAMAEAPGAAGRFRPSVKPPEVEGLYLVSDTVSEGTSIGFAACAGAALYFMDNLL